jgi:hypothetical protein
MKEEITEILRKTPNLRGREIAKKLGHDKSEVNAFLHLNLKYFTQNNDSEWSLANEFHVAFATNSWIDSAEFEDTLARCGSPLDDDCTSVFFIIPDGCSFLLEAVARLMALSNQLVLKQKLVVLDFGSSHQTYHYLNRIGFFDYLAPEVTILPKRPATSKATTHRGNADTVFELSKIDPIKPDKSIPEQLRNVFVTHAGESYAQPAFTVLAELFDNVRDHSKSKIPGLAAVQFYKSTRHPHIQTVISDSGIGIIGTLKPLLNEKYKPLAKKIAGLGAEGDAYLIKEIFEKGEITQFEKGRGLGLKASANVAAKFNAKISIRQENLEVILFYKNGVLDNFCNKLDLPKIYGTHICFDFIIDKNKVISLN